MYLEKNNFRKISNDTAIIAYYITKNIKEIFKKNLPN